MKVNKNNNGGARIGHVKRTFEGNTYDYLGSGQNGAGSLYATKSLDNLITSFAADSHYNARYSTVNKFFLLNSVVDLNDYIYFYVGLQ